MNRIGYTGQRLDAETGLMPLGNGERYYLPGHGRFIQQDSWTGDAMMPQSLNRFAYVYGNPFRYTDPNGNEPQNGATWMDIASSIQSNFQSLPFEIARGLYWDYSRGVVKGVGRAIVGTAVLAVGLVTDTSATVSAIGAGLSQWGSDLWTGVFNPSLVIDSVIDCGASRSLEILGEAGGETIGGEVTGTVGGRLGSRIAKTSVVRTAVNKAGQAVPLVVREAGESLTSLANKPLVQEARQLFADAGKSIRGDVTYLKDLYSGLRQFNPGQGGWRARLSLATDYANGGAARSMIDQMMADVEVAAQAVKRRPWKIDQQGSKAFADVEVEGYPSGRRWSAAGKKQGTGAAGYDYVGPIDEAINPLPPSRYVPGRTAPAPGMSAAQGAARDAERNLLSNLAVSLPENASGRIVLFSKFIVCRSCRAQVRAFRRMFPRIQLDVYSGPATRGFGSQLKQGLKEAGLDVIDYLRGEW